MEAYQIFDNNSTFFIDAVDPAGALSVLIVAKMVALGRGTSIPIIFGEFGLVCILAVLVGVSRPDF